ncbi:M14 family metallopeptidase [Pararhizobium sp. YC-54]|uniref:M14 family metallopeptidase n=1 Tax=Pararhizobium sp. YC-54 TaxID=2986920 RepID=UPI0021F7A6F1|nr:M14 family metallopeptidase [Pararhizobium sp. YC-54]MCW0001566.1 M14 family metallopeptidase [Pararhizobium sp. YC-54]
MKLQASSFNVNHLTSPKNAFGHDLGEDYFLPNYTELVSYWKTLAAESSRARLVDIGPTSEGRRQYMMVVSSPENLADLDRYKAIAARLARAEGLTDEQARELASEGKAVVWVDGGMHSDEVVTVQSVMDNVYDMLSADDAEARTILDNVIILFGHANPDGHELFANWYMRNDEPTKREYVNVPELFQKYVGHDNNRDFYLVSQPETLNLNTVFFREWYPQIIYNQHQAGPLGAVAFIPPFRDPFNYNYDPLVMAELSEVAGAMHTRLISEGKAGSAIRSVQNYSSWTNGLLRTAAYFHNAIGILTEVIGNPTPHQLPLVAEHQLPCGDLPLPVRPQIWHMRQSIEYSRSMVRAALNYAAINRAKVLYNIYRMGANSITRGSQDSWTITDGRVHELKAAGSPQKLEIWAAWMGSSVRGEGYIDPALYETVLRHPAKRDPRGYIMPADQPDFPTATKFVNSLIKAGIDVEQATAPFKVGDTTYPAGSYVVKTAQAYRPHVLDMFEPQDHPHDFAYPGGPPVAPYDVAGYTLALQMGVQFDRVLDGFDGPFQRIKDAAVPQHGRIIGTGSAGFLIRHEINDAATLTNRLLEAGQSVSWVKNSISVDDTSFAPGTIWVTASSKARDILADATHTLGIDAYAVDNAPAANRLLDLKPVRIGIVDVYGGLESTGWTQWTLEQFEFPYTIVRPQRLDRGDLGKDFDVIILPDSAVDQQSLVGRGLADRQPKPEEIPTRYHDWLGKITDNKTLPQLEQFIRMGGSLVAIGSSTKVVQFFKLPVEPAPSEMINGELQPLPETKFYVPGSILSLKVDNTLPLAFGLPATVDVFFSRSPSFKFPKDEQGLRRVGWFSCKHPLRSGWAWGQEHLEGAIAVAEADMDKGKLFLIGPEVTMRGQPHGSFKLLFNAIYYGPAAARN